MENNNEFIELKTFHRDANNISKEKLSNIPLDHVRGGTYRTYEDSGKQVENKTMIIFGTHKYYIAMSISDLKTHLSNKLGFKFH
jgi:hypothetical protein